MLAYLFFHRPVEHVEAADYEGRLRRFHEALRASRVPGFVASCSFRVGGHYCDWYLVESSAALDALNDAAVSGDRAEPHSAVARVATDGAGKLLKLARGDANHDGEYEVRLSKPAGMAYEDFYSLLRPWTERRGYALWRRMMVLGPPPEFCLVAPAPEELPVETRPEIFRRERV